MKYTIRKKQLAKFALTFSACFLLSTNMNANKPETEQATEAKVEQDLKSVRGFVVDELGEPLVGVIVEATGSKKSAVTNTEGKYTLMALEGDVLKFSQIGMTNKEEKITSSRIVNIALAME